MADISTFDNFFDNFPPKSGFMTKRRKISECTIVSEWPSCFHTNHYERNEHLLQSKMFGEYCRATLCTVFKDNFIFVSFLFLEQCFQLSLSDEIGGTFFDIDNFLIIPKYIFFDINNLPII